MDIQQFLHSLPSFESFAPGYLETLAHALRVREYPDGFVFTSQDDQSDSMYLLIDGKVRISERDDIAGLVREVKELHGGELFGLLSLLDNMPAAATCTAVSPVRAAALSREEFNRMFRDAPPIGHQLHYMIAVQLARDLQNRNKSLRALLRREVAA